MWNWRSEFEHRILTGFTVRGHDVWEADSAATRRFGLPGGSGRPVGTEDRSKGADGCIPPGGAAGKESFYATRASVIIGRWHLAKQNGNRQIEPDFRLPANQSLVRNREAEAGPGDITRSLGTSMD